MTRRTAAHFAAEATADPFELELADGTILTPRPRDHWSYPEVLLNGELEVEHAQNVQEMYQGTRIDTSKLEGSFMLGLKLRFTTPGLYLRLAEKQAAAGGNKCGPLKLRYTDPEAYTAWAAEQETDAEGNPPPSPDTPLPGFDEFWVEFSALPEGPREKPEPPVHDDGEKKGEPTGEPAPRDYGLRGLVREIDEHYIPAAPADRAARAAAAADGDSAAAGKLLGVASS